ncbi:TfoX/Sxy family protein [Actinoplanes sp. NPDC051475]|uniref:TfoX/Sxy family protein n=1 Tax=Actinoplanes sp. NPDC051475 TaxID=3157225 RepID=UPI00344D218C
MSTTDTATLESLVDRLAELMPLRTRGFFGGTALVCDGTQFAMVMGTTVYFVVDEATRPRYRAAGSEPFIYLTGSGPVTVGRYHAVPPHVLDDPETLHAWAGQAIQAATTAPARGRRRTGRQHPRTPTR